MTPLLPLENFRRVLGYNPWHFFGLQSSSTTQNQARISSDCNALVYQYTWQNTNAAGRTEVLAAIQSAEDRLADYLHFRVAPHYVVETVPWPRYQGGQYIRWSPIDAMGRWVSVSAGEKYVQAMGVETRSSIALAQAVAYSDLNGDGLNELATITVNVGAITDPDQIEVFFNTTDRYDGTAIPATGAPDTIDAALRWRIQPVVVRIAGGVATITGPSWIFVKPLLYEGGVPLDPATPGNFATTVDIYRRYTDPDGTTTDTSQAVLVWETTPCGGWWCCDGATYTTNSSDPAAVAYAIARAGIRDSVNGEVAPGPAVYNSASAVWGTASFAAGFEPDRVILRYRAGIPLAAGQMQTKWQTIVARFAMAELAERLAACDIANKELWRWQFDLARSSGANDEAYGAVSTRDLENPFGTRRGHVFAWRAIQQLMTGQGILI